MCDNTPPCASFLTMAAMGVHAHKVTSRQLPRCGVCDCAYKCDCDHAKYNTRACKHVHAVHALHYTVPATVGIEPMNGWLTGVSTDEPDYDEEIQLQGDDEVRNMSKKYHEF